MRPGISFYRCHQLERSHDEKKRCAPRRFQFLCGQRQRERCLDKTTVNINVDEAMIPPYQQPCKPSRRGGWKEGLFTIFYPMLSEAARVGTHVVLKPPRCRTEPSSAAPPSRPSGVALRSWCSTPAPSNATVASIATRFPDNFACESGVRYFIIYLFIFQPRQRCRRGDRK